VCRGQRVTANARLQNGLNPAGVTTVISYSNTHLISFAVAPEQYKYPSHSRTTTWNIVIRSLTVTRQSDW